MQSIKHNNELIINKNIFQLIAKFPILIIAYRQTDMNDKTIYSIPLCLGIPSLQLWDHISSLQIRSKLEIENFSFGPPFGFQANDEKFWKLSFGTPFKNFLQLGLQKELASLALLIKLKIIWNSSEWLYRSFSFVIEWKLTVN
jgi:hypothetical protein